MTMQFIASLTLLTSLLVTHPVYLVIVICTQSLLAAVTIAMNTLTPWFSMILFLVFMGGLMVLFVYISSLASNEEFSVNSFNLNSCFFIMLSVFILLRMSINTQSHSAMDMNLSKLVNEVYSNPNYKTSIVFMVYLLLVLIISVHIISMQEGPLRSTTNSVSYS